MNLYKSLRQWQGSRVVTTLVFCVCSLTVNAHELIHEAPWDACESAEKSQECSYSNEEGDLYRGTCQIFSEALMCVRNQPILYAERRNTDLHDTEHHHSHTHE